VGHHLIENIDEYLKFSFAKIAYFYIKIVKPNSSVYRKIYEKEMGINGDLVRLKNLH